MAYPSIFELRFFKVCSLLLCGLITLTSCTAQSQKSEEAFDILYDDISEDPERLDLFLENTGWSGPISSTSNWERTSMICAGETVQGFILPPDTQLYITFASDFRLDAGASVFPRTCIEEWSIDIEHVPGLIQGKLVETGATCLQNH